VYKERGRGRREERERERERGKERHRERHILERMLRCKCSATDKPRGSSRSSSARKFGRLAFLSFQM